MGRILVAVLAVVLGSCGAPGPGGTTTSGVTASPDAGVQPAGDAPTATPANASPAIQPASSPPPQAQPASQPQGSPEPQSQPQQGGPQPPQSSPGGGADAGTGTGTAAGTGTATGTSAPPPPPPPAMTCAPGLQLCGSTCVDVHANDPSNCGACGRACPAGSRCDFGGTCFVTTCPGAEVFCGGGNPTMPDPCVDLQSNSTNCGACGNVCASNYCSKGVCADGAFCAPGSLQCGLTCVRPSTDVKNCGGCGNVCAADEICTNGQCTASCPQAGETMCPPSTTDVPPYCTNLATDFGNCGACGNRCTGPNDVCQGGQCVGGGQQLCPAGQTWCAANQYMNPAGCYDLQTDAQHCSACDAFPCHSMLFGPGVCMSGVCVYTP